MNIAKCLNRHYYDKDKFFECPTCKKGNFNINKEVKSVFADETQILDDEQTMQIDNNQNGESPTAVIDGNEDQTMILAKEQTMILHEDKTQIIDDNKQEKKI